MIQCGLANAKFSTRNRRTRRENFIAEMELLVPIQMIGLIEPLNPMSGRVRLQPTGVAKVLRTYLLREWYGLLDEALEDVIYGSQAMRDFVSMER